jgi:fluoride exporter
VTGLGLWLALAGCGGLGVLARFGVDSIVSERLGGRLPWGTFAVNISGALALGLLVGAAVRGAALELAATAALGSYTTFSTWVFEAHRLAEDGEAGAALANVAGTLAAGLAAVALGRLLG